MASWRNYYKRRYKRYYKKKYNSSYTKRSYGQMKAAKQQADQASFVMNIPTQINVKNVQSTLPNGTQVEVGTFPLNIYDLLRKSEFYQSYANMYDEFKVDNIKVKLIPTKYNVTVGDTNNAGYQSFTVYTAWDRTGLNAKQLFLRTDGLYNDNPIDVNKPNGPKNRDYIGKPGDFDGLYCIIGSDITTYSSAESRQVSVGQNSSIVRWLKPKTLSEKSQWISTAQLKPWYYQYSAQDAAFKYIPTIDDNSLVPDISQLQNLYDRSIGTVLSNYSPAIANNPCFLEEDPTINFKPTLLVGLFPADAENVDLPRTVYFNVETEVSCTFRGLRKSKVVNSAESTTAVVPSPSTNVNNESLDVFIDTFPTTRTYTKNDLSPGKTGFLPVSIEIDGPNFLTYYSDELGNLYEQPITHNGKYKIVPYESNPSGDPDQGFPIAGFLPKYLANQASGDYDLNIQIPNSGGDPQPPEITPNTCYFKIDNEVVEYVNNYGQVEEERGTLRLPSSDTDLMQKVDFDIGDKNYATEVAIDLSDVNIVEDNTAVLEITPAVLEFVNNNPQWENVGRVTLPNAFLTALTDYEDNGKGFATNLVINVGSLAGFFNLDSNTQNISQNGTYQIGNFDNDAADIEIERQNNRGMSIRLIEDGKEDGTKSDTKDDPTPTPNPNANYTMGRFTVNVQPKLEDKTVTVTTTDGTQTITHGSGYDGLGTVTINSNVELEDKSFTVNSKGTFEILPESNYKGLSKVTINNTGIQEINNYKVNAYTSAYGNDPDYQNVTQFISTITPTDNNYALSSVTCKSSVCSFKQVEVTNNDTINLDVRNEYPAGDVLGYQNIQIIPDFQPRLEDKIVDITTNDDTQIITPSSNYDGLGSVTINTSIEPRLQNITKSISTNGTQTVTCDSGYDGLGTVTINTQVSNHQTNLPLECVLCMNDVDIGNSGLFNERILFPGSDLTTLLSLESYSTLILVILIKIGINDASPVKYMKAFRITNFTERTIDFKAANTTDDGIQTFIWSTEWDGTSFSNWDDTFNIRFNGSRLISLPWGESKTLYGNFTDEFYLINSNNAVPNIQWIDLNGITLLGH